MDDKELPIIYVLEKEVLLVVSDLICRFPDYVWDAMVKYVADYRSGKAKDGELITGLPKLEIENTEL